MFSVPMHLPTELEDSDIPQSVFKDQMAHIMPHPPEGKAAVDIFESVDKIQQIIHNSASGNISRAKTKQAFYFEQRHRGVPLQIGNKVLHYNRRAGQWLSDKLHGHWIGSYIIVGMTGKNKYQVKDMNGYVLKTYLNGSNMKRYLTKEEIMTDEPDLVPAGELPEKPDSVDDLLASINYEKEWSKSCGVKKRKAADVDLLFPDPQQKPSKKKKTCKVTTDSPPAKPISDRQNEMSAPTASQVMWDKQNVKIINPAINIPADKEKKRKFFNEMIKAASETKVGHVTGGSEKRCAIASSDSEDDVKITGVEEKSSYVFNPLTLQQRRVICERTSLEMRKEQLNHTNAGEKMLARPSRVRTVKGDGNCFFRAMAISITRWEVGHLKIRQLVCDYIKSFGPYTHECEGKLYLNQTKMKTSTRLCVPIPNHFVEFWLLSQFGLGTCINMG